MLFAIFLNVVAKTCLPINLLNSKNKGQGFIKSIIITGIIKFILGCFASFLKF